MPGETNAEHQAKAQAILDAAQANRSAARREADRKRAAKRQRWEDLEKLARGDSEP